MSRVHLPLFEPEGSVLGRNCGADGEAKLAGSQVNIFLSTPMDADLLLRIFRESLSF